MAHLTEADVERREGLSKDERRIQALRDAITAERTGVLPEDERTDSETGTCFTGLITGDITSSEQSPDFGPLAWGCIPLDRKIFPDEGMKKNNQ